MTLTWAEAKQYLRVSTADDVHVQTLSTVRFNLCGCGRQTVTEYTARTDEIAGASFRSCLFMSM